MPSHIVLGLEMTAAACSASIVLPMTQLIAVFVLRGSHLVESRRLADPVLAAPWLTLFSAHTSQDSQPLSLERFARMTKK